MPLADDDRPNGERLMSYGSEEKASQERPWMADEYNPGASGGPLAPLQAAERIVLT